MNRKYLSLFEKDASFFKFKQDMRTDLFRKILFIVCLRKLPKFYKAQ